jgi:hypothetical protein
MYITETYILYYDDNYVIWVWIVLFGTRFLQSFKIIGGGGGGGLGPPSTTPLVSATD